MHADQLRLPHMAATLAIDVGATSTRLAVIRDGVIGRRRVLSTSGLARPVRGIADGLVGAVEALAVEDGSPRVAAIGVGLAAFVDAAGSVLQPREFGIPGGPVLHDALAEAFRVPVVVDNDANLAAVAECRLGAGRGFGTVAVLTLGTNIGMGLVIDGRIHRGAHGAAGEAGLLLVPVSPTGGEVDGLPLVDAPHFGRVPAHDRSGYAWIEEIVGGGAIAAAAERDDAGGPRPPGPRPPAPRHVLTTEALDNPTRRHLVDRAIEGWALVVADITALIDPDLIVLSGSVAVDAAHLIDRLRRRVEQLVPLQPEIRLGSLGADAELLGGHLLARAALKSGRSVTPEPGSRLVQAEVKT